MLEIEDLHAYRGLSYVLQGVNMRAEAAACTTVLGRNGMGKTTLIRTLMGLTPIARGTVTFRGRRLNELDTNRIARLGLGLVPQGRHVFPSLSVEENLNLAARPPLDGSSQNTWSLQRIYDLFPNLKDRRKNGAGQLSGGEQQMLAIGRALMTNPSLILMDEPSEGLAPVIVYRVQSIIESLRLQSLSILLIEQNYQLGMSSADYVYVLSKGHVVWSGKPYELDAAEDIKRAHLGV